ncbi:hypothetical protein [Mesorhizobium sp. B2-8-9]|uniref:hypothetical protein n=1 Tax=Mesorhizobium sp. B2-8-9 TaxID=2589899 RepID=UPI001126CE78|nr:hypothetical protein [Mesorhizobium sp. B2-8-9]TPI79512.1 hypothetical protein FJ423_15050 [Mesorhizobium sp. B2-8-9]
MECELTFSNTPTGHKQARLFLAIDRIWANFGRYVWDAPAHRAEFNYEDEALHIVSYFDSANIRTTVWHNKAYNSWNAMIAATRLGQQFVSIVEIGGPNDRQIVSPDNFYLADLTERMLHGQDQDGNHHFAISSPAYVAEFLDRQLKPWAVHPEEPRHKLKPITPALIAEIVRRGYRSKDVNNWVSPGGNIGKIQ